MKQLTQAELEAQIAAMQEEEAQLAQEERGGDSSESGNVRPDDPGEQAGSEDEGQAGEAEAGEEGGHRSPRIHSGQHVIASDATAVPPRFVTVGFVTNS